MLTSGQIIVDYLYRFLLINLTDPDGRSRKNSSNTVNFFPVPIMTMPQVLSVSLVAAAAIQSLEVDCALALGDKGLDVQALQLILKELRIYNGVLDGEFDFKTERGLLFLQNYLNVCLTGQLDIETWYALTYWAEESASHQANKLAATC